MANGVIGPTLVQTLERMMAAEVAGAKGRDGEPLGGDAGVGMDFLGRKVAIRILLGFAGPFLYRRLGAIETEADLARARDALAGRRVRGGTNVDHTVVRHEAVRLLTAAGIGAGPAKQLVDRLILRARDALAL